MSRSNTPRQSAAVAVPVAVDVVKTTPTRAVEEFPEFKAIATGDNGSSNNVFSSSCSNDVIDACFGILMGVGEKEEMGRVGKGCGKVNVFKENGKTHLSENAWNLGSLELTETGVAYISSCCTAQHRENHHYRLGREPDQYRSLLHSCNAQRLRCKLCLT